jgi:ParB-like chromosome segregation protein Spo0J
MGFWSRAPIAPNMPVERLKQLYVELGSLQAVADAEDLDVAWVGRRLKAYDRRIAGANADYAGPERRGGGERRASRD